MPSGLALESNHWFGPEDIAGLTTAFEAALAKLAFASSMISLASVMVVGEAACDCWDRK